MRANRKIQYYNDPDGVQSTNHHSFCRVYIYVWHMMVAKISLWHMKRNLKTYYVIVNLWKKTLFQLVKCICDMWILFKIYAWNGITTPFLLLSFNLCRKLSNWIYFREKGLSYDKEALSDFKITKWHHLFCLDNCCILPCIVVHNGPFRQNKWIIHAF